jgi:hypothetical protein
MVSTRSGEITDASSFYRIWLPGVIVAAAVVASLAAVALPSTATDGLQALFVGETGIIERATALVLLLALFYGIRGILLARLFNEPVLMGWIALNTLAAIYFMGEEVSWGQQFGGFGAVDWAAATNAQGELKLHEMSTWLDEKPRLALFLWTVIGGIVVPWWRRRGGGGSGAAGGHWIDWFWPTMAVLPTAVLIVAVRLPEVALAVGGAAEAGAASAWVRALQPPEVQEFLYAVFVLIYLSSMVARMRASMTLPRAHKQAHAAG